MTRNLRNLITAHDHEETASHEIDDGSDIGLEKRLLSQLMIQTVRDYERK